MPAWSQIYDFDKSVMLNVLYDTLEAMNFQIDKADSDKGEIMIRMSRSEKKPLLFRLSVRPINRLDGEKTEIIVTADPLSPESPDWMTALQDEIKGTLRRSGMG